MSRVRILPDILTNKIAAGEVVQRPSSVVKELLENALDARSTRIIVEIEGGGRSLIRVSDNGVGMIRDDALLAVERYATSKIYTDSDLFAIGTLGFRGEALPSIASVSRFTLETHDDSELTGVRLEIKGGKLVNVSEVGAPRGTDISVKQLFFNTPARRKFLKSAGTEMSHIGDAVSAIALGWPSVHFKLIHNKRVVKNYPGAPDPLIRVSDVLGKGTFRELYGISGAGEGGSVSGWVSSSRLVRSTSRGIYLFVNGRYVKDRIIQHALMQGYAGRLTRGRYPVAVLFIKVPPDRVDVNVHPAKNEVKFSQQGLIHSLVERAVSEVLKEAERPGWLENKTAPEITEEVTPFSPPEPARAVEKQRGSFQQRVISPREKAAPVKTFREEPPVSDLKNAPPSVTAPIVEDRLKGIRVIGQFRRTYIICESYEGLILIDQHAAHERIIYERLQRISEKSRKESQVLLLPETFEVGFREEEVLNRMIPKLLESGLEIEPFGGGTFVVKAVPVLLQGREIRPLVLEILEKTAQIGFSSGMERIMNECLMLMACHGAIRANQALSHTEIGKLLDDLTKCSDPSHCPHGRPTWIKWTKGDLERSFGRT